MEKVGILGKMAFILGEIERLESISERQSIYMLSVLQNLLLRLSICFPTLA